MWWHVGLGNPSVSQGESLLRCLRSAACWCWFSTALNLLVLIASFLEAGHLSMENLRADGVGDKSTWFDYAWQHFVFCLLVLGLVFFAMRDISLNRCTNWWVPVSVTLLMSIALIIATYYKLYKLGGTRTATKLRISKSLKPLISKTMSSDITCCKFANLQWLWIIASLSLNKVRGHHAPFLNCERQERFWFRFLEVAA